MLTQATQDLLNSVDPSITKGVSQQPECYVYDTVDDMYVCKHEGCDVCQSFNLSL